MKSKRLLDDGRMLAAPIPAVTLFPPTLLAPTLVTPTFPTGKYWCNGPKDAFE